MAFQDFDQISQRRKLERQQKLRKRISIAIVSSVVLLLIVGSAIGIVLQNGDGGAKSNSKEGEKGENKATAGGNIASPAAFSTSEKAVKSVCVSTDYKDRCESSLTNAVKESVVKISKPEDFVKASMVVASDGIDKSIKYLKTLKFDTPEKKAAFDDCMTLLDDAKDELNSSVSAIDGKKLKDINSKMPDVNNWLSAALSHQQTCIDAVPEGEEKSSVEKSLNATKELSSNSLAIVSQADSILSSIKLPAAPKRRLLSMKSRYLSKYEDDEFPAWMGSREHRRKLMAENPIYTPNVTVAKDGSGNFSTINEALSAVPSSYQGRYVIYVKEGVYEENVVITKKMVNLTIYGDGSQKSMITGTKSKQEGLPAFNTATFVALGDGFRAQSIGFRNTAGPEKRQAVALRVQSDYATFLNCRMEGYESVIFAQAHRQYYRSCYITGSADIIFGDAAAVFQNCDIYVRKPLENQQNTVIAQGRVDKRQTTGIVLQNCKILASEQLEPVKAQFKTYLGRPLKKFSRAIVMETEIGEFVQPEGWVTSEDFATKTCYFGEFQNKGPRAQTDARVNWPGFKVMDEDEAQKYTVGSFIQGNIWLNTTGAPVNLGLFVS